MNLQKISNFAFTLTLALGFAGASALSSLSTVQAQDPPAPIYVHPQHQHQHQHPQHQHQHPHGVIGGQDAYRLGDIWGRDDARKGANFRPCSHQEYMYGDNFFRRDFIRGYSRSYFNY